MNPYDPPESKTDKDGPDTTTQLLPARPFNRTKRPAHKPPPKITVVGATLVAAFYIVFFWAFIIFMRANNSWVLSSPPERLLTIACFGFCGLLVIVCLWERQIDWMSLTVVLVMYGFTCLSFWLILPAQWTLIGVPH